MLLIMGIDVTFEVQKNKHMKKRFKFLAASALLLAGTAFLLQSCDKIITLNLDKEYSNIDFMITAPQPAGTIVIDEEVVTDLATLASSQGFDINKIESAEIKSVTLTINDPNTNPVTTAIITSVKASMFADNVQITEIASDDATHTSPTQIDMDLKGLDIAPYLKANKFTFRAEIVTNAAITHDVPVNVALKCAFKVKPLK